MSKVIEAIVAKLSEEAAKEFKAAVKDMTLLDNSGGEYVNRDKANADLAAAKKVSDGMEAEVKRLQGEAAKGGDLSKALEESQAKLKELEENHKKDIAEFSKKTERGKKEDQIKRDLMKAGAHDPEDAFLVLSKMGLDLDALTFNDKGSLMGHSDMIKEAQEKKVYLFDVKEPKGTHIPTSGGPKGIDDIVNGALAQLGYKTGAK